MLKIKYIDKIKDKHGIIQYYTIIDLQGNRKTVTSEALKKAIRNNQVDCVNLTLTSDNRLIEKGEKTKVRPTQIQKKPVVTYAQTPVSAPAQVKRNLTPVEMYKEYLNTPYMQKIRTLGVRPEAEYEVNGDKVILKKLFIKEGTFTILPFVTDCDNNTFKECIKLKLINKSKITDMSGMFEDCEHLQELDLSEFDTSKVTGMKAMFNRCTSLQTLDLNKFNTSNVTDMSGMFYECTGLQHINLRNFDTSKVTSMGHMFYHCYNLKELNLSSFNTLNVTNMDATFAGCKSLTELNLSNFYTPKLDDINAIFSGCTKLKDLNIKNFDTSNVTEMESLFHECRHLERLDVSSFDTSNVTDMVLMFYNCERLEDLDLSNFDIKQAICDNMFTGCTYIHTFRMPNCIILPKSYSSDTERERIREKYNKCMNELIRYNESTNAIYEIKGNDVILKKVLLSEGEFVIPTFVTELERHFNWEGNNVSAAFEYCTDIKVINSSQITDMSFMFGDTQCLSALDLSKFDTSLVTNMSGMFSNTVIEELDISNFNTSHVVNMSKMFKGCERLETLNIGEINTSQVENMRQMFSGCYSLEELDLSKIDTSSLKDKYEMFENCPNKEQFILPDKLK